MSDMDTRPFVGDAGPAEAPTEDALAPEMTPEAVEPEAPAGPVDPNVARPSSIRDAVTGTGELAYFTWRVIREIPSAVRLYPAEIVRHAGVLIRANAAVVLFMMFLLGAVMGLTAHFLYTSIGIDSYIASVNAVAGTRGLIQIVFGWIIAAKVGCGIVAELGAMRISDEIDAMEVMGIRSIPYLVGTRVVAGMIVVPALFVVGMSVNFVAGYLFNVNLLQTVSGGGFTYFLFLFQNVMDLVFAIVWGAIFGFIIFMVSCFYGFTAQGGPVGVGRNTAQSMLLNLVLISVVAMLLVQLFYGNNPNAPIGN